MYSVYNFLLELGTHAIEHIWFPVLIWTIFSFIAFLTLNNLKSLNPLYHYHLRAATVLALPIGILASVLLQHGLSNISGSGPVETALIVVSNPVSSNAATSAVNNEAGFTLSMIQPSVVIGMITLFLLFFAAFFILRFCYDYIQLRKLSSGLELHALEDHGHRSENYSGYPISLAFHDNPYVPFTFGWRKPVIVLPERLFSEPEKLQMALKHELVHIQRKDYLLQLFLSVMESVFWFHPLIRITNQQIDTYREISCDQQVLNETEFSVKSYASLLLELLPLSSASGRLSVSMAVKQSTLTQRIKTMKYHKLHRSSMRHSMIFLLLMLVGITLPIACSDMRGPELIDRTTLEEGFIQHKGAVIEINGKEAIDLSTQSAAKTNATGALFFNAKEYGSFMIALQQFPGSKRTGKIENNQVTFRINSMDVKITSEIPFITNVDRTDIWVAHSTLESKISHGTAGLIDIDEYLKSIGSSGSVARQGEEDYFVVVEEMPKPIGGMASIRSRIQYPEMARRAGIEGRVIVQFIVNEEGNVENEKVVRGIGGGADQEALRVIKETKFTPGVQRGRNVRVQFSLPVNFRLENSDFGKTLPNNQQGFNGKTHMEWEFINEDKVNVTVRVQDNAGMPIAGANVTWGNKYGAATNGSGVAEFLGIKPIAMEAIYVSHISYGKTGIRTVSIKS